MNRYKQSIFLLRARNQDCQEISTRPRMANSSLSRFVILRQIPIPDHEVDLGPQRKPNLTIDSRPLSILRETLLRAVTVLVIGSSDPRTALLRPRTGRRPAMESAPAFTGNRGLLAGGAAARLCKAPLTRPRVTKPRSTTGLDQSGVFGFSWCTAAAIRRVI